MSGILGFLGIQVYAGGGLASSWTREHPPHLRQAAPQLPVAPQLQHADRSLTPNMCRYNMG